MNIKLNTHEMNVLEELKLPARIISSLRATGGEELSSDEWDIVAEACMDDLQEHGWDAQYSVNERGRLLTGLIDKIVDPEAPNAQSQSRRCGSR
ncbi:MAG: hypothetical protein ACREAA_20555 [Candidatus Polarisedimenticolia bacterium]